MRDSRSKSSEIAPGVYLAAAGPRTNAYFVRSGASWVLIDTGWRGRAAAIKTQAEAVFGRDARPAAILLTHIHPDHSGSALPLAEIWEVPVYVHPDELAMAGPDYPMEFANPVDRRISAVLGRLIPRRTRERTSAESDLRGVIRGLDSRAEVPGLPGWECVPTPGHTPGHVAFHRRSDGVLITGDAVLTIDANSVLGIVFGAEQLSGPPRYFTWNWSKEVDSVAVLAALEPQALAPGHGQPLVGAATAPQLRAFADELRAN